MSRITKRVARKLVQPFFCVWGVSLHIVGFINLLKFVEGIDLNDIVEGTLADTDVIVFLAVVQSDNVPISFLAAGCEKHLFNVITLPSPKIHL